MPNNVTCQGMGSLVGFLVFPCQRPKCGLRQTGLGPLLSYQKGGLWPPSMWALVYPILGVPVVPVAWGILGRALCLSQPPEIPPHHSYPSGPLETLLLSSFDPSYSGLGASGEGVGYLGSAPLRQLPIAAVGLRLTEPSGILGSVCPNAI